MAVTGIYLEKNIISYMSSILNKSIFRLLVIYGYLLFIITVFLYISPGFIDYNKNAEKEITKENRQNYITGGYVEDKKLFDTTEMYFPVAFSGKMEDCLYYTDSYGAERTYGGERSHEGCDIMTQDNIRGEFPVVAVCDGKIEQLGWLELGGYRIGLRSDTGVYYYYAHLFKYEPGLAAGSQVQAGQVIGYIGDTGYSKVEGTTGNFDVHLHFGIYLEDKEGREYTVNPYFLLKKLEKSVIKYRFQTQ